MCGTERPSPDWMDLVFLSVPFLIIYGYIQEVGKEKIYHELRSGLFPFILTVCLIGIIIFLSFRIYSKVKKNNEKNTNLKLELMRLNKYYNSFEDINKAESKLEELIKNNPKVEKKFQSLIEDISFTFEQEKEELMKEQQKIRTSKKIERAKEKRKKEKIKYLVRYFQKKNSSDIIPKKALRFNKDIKEKAVEEYHEKIRKKGEYEETWKRAVEFVTEAKAYPINFNEMDKKGQKMYKKALRLFKAGKLKKPIVVKEEDKHLIEKRFFHAQELSPEQRDRLIHQYGYRHRSFISPIGKSGNNLIIKNDERKESDYHFCMKHLFAETNKHSIIEYAIKNIRTDVAFVFGNKKIAVEIERKTNKDLQIANKVKWLNKNFDYWVFLCSRDHLKHYRKYVDNKKSFCLRLKVAYNKINDLAAALN